MGLHDCNSAKQKCRNGNVENKQRNATSRHTINNFGFGESIANDDEAEDREDGCDDGVHGTRENSEWRMANKEGFDPLAFSCIVIHLPFAIFLEPGMTLPILLLESGNGICLLQRQSNIIQTVQQTMLAEGIDLKPDHTAIGTAYFL